MPFYKERPCFLAMDGAIATPHMYSATRGKKESLAGTLLEEEVQEGPKIMDQLSAKEQVPGGHTDNSGP